MLFCRCLALHAGATCPSSRQRARQCVQVLEAPCVGSRFAFAVPSASRGHTSYQCYAFQIWFHEMRRELYGACLLSSYCRQFPRETCQRRQVIDGGDDYYVFQIHSCRARIRIQIALRPHAIIPLALSASPDFLNCNIIQSVMIRKRMCPRKCDSITRHFTSAMIYFRLPPWQRGEVGAEYMARVVQVKQHWASHWVRCGPMLGAQRLCGLRIVGNFRIPCSFSRPASAQ